MKGIPKNERIWEDIRPDKSSRFLITSKPDRTAYFIYQIVDGAAKKLGQNRNPKKLTQNYVNW